MIYDDRKIEFGPSAQAGGPFQMFSKRKKLY